MTAVCVNIFIAKVETNILKKSVKTARLKALHRRSCQEIMLYLLSYWKDNSIVPKKIIIMIIIIIILIITIIVIIMIIIIIIRRRRRRRTLKHTFQDIGLYWGLDK